MSCLVILCEYFALPGHNIHYQFIYVLVDVFIGQNIATKLHKNLFEELLRRE